MPAAASYKGVTLAVEVTTLREAGYAGEPAALAGAARIAFRRE
jgi:hypothetical protein